MGIYLIVTRSSLCSDHVNLLRFGFYSRIWTLCSNLDPEHVRALHDLHHLVSMEDAFDNHSMNTDRLKVKTATRTFGVGVFSLKDATTQP